MLHGETPKTMKPLPKTFTKGGFDFIVIERLGNVALLSKTKNGAKSYEVVIIQSHNGYTIGNKTIEAAESMPPSESWGRLGWSYTSLDEAIKRFDQQCDEHFKQS